MTELLQTCIVGGNIIPTTLLCLFLVYWLFVLTGAVGLELFDFDLDLDVDADVDVDAGIDIGGTGGSFNSMLSTGVVALKFLNIGNVPIMLWASLFSLSLWTLTMLLDDPSNHESLFRETMILIRNGFFSLILAKVLTQPLRGRFEPVEPNRPRDLIGTACVITTSEVTETFGQAQHEAQGAPLLLNVRTTAGPLAKGDTAVIVDFDPQQRVYFVKQSDQEVEK
jgi:hypothetical protein